MRIIIKQTINNKTFNKITINKIINFKIILKITIKSFYNNYRKNKTK